MKIQITPRPENMCEEYQFYGFTIDEQEAFEILLTEPEDRTLGRDVNPVYSIPKLMQKAWLAGKNGESFEIVN